MAAFNALQRAAFAGYVFPVSEIKVSCGTREHVHEYPHTPGGAPEKLGRKLYEIFYRAPFHNTFARYPQLWPETLASLRIIFEGSRSFDLVIPTIGTITAYPVSWTETADMKAARSGVSVEMTFREDQTDLFLVQNLIAVEAANLKNAGVVFQKMVEQRKLQGDLFDSINEMLNSISSIGDQFQLVGNLYSDKLGGIVQACEAIDRSFSFFNKPGNHVPLSVLHDLWAQSAKLKADIAKTASPVIPFVTNAVMSVGDVARRLYGDNSRAVEILRMNVLENPFAIPRGTTLQVYAPPAAFKKAS